MHDVEALRRPGSESKQSHPRKLPAPAWAGALFSGSILLLFVLSTLGMFVSVPLDTKPLRGMLSAVCLAAAAWTGRGQVRGMIVGLLAVAAMVGAAGGMDIRAALVALQVWADIGVLLAVVPLVSRVLDKRGHIAAVVQLTERFSRSATQAVITVTGHLVGSVALLTVVPILGDFLEVRSMPRPVRYAFSQSIVRGFVSSLTWTPNSGAMGVVLVATNLQWVSLIRILAPVSLLGLLFAVLWGEVVRRLDERRGPAGSHQASMGRSGASAPFTSSGRLGELALFVVGVFGSIMVLEQTLDTDILRIVPFVITTASLLLFGIVNQWRTGVASLVEHFSTRIPLQAGEVGIILSAGVLGAVVEDVGAAGPILDQIRLLVGTAGVPFFVVLPLLIVVLSFLGIAPVVGVALVAAGMPLEGTGLAAEVYASALLLGSGAAVLVSPVTPTMLMASSYAGRTPLRFGLVGNGLYAVAYALMITIAYMILVG